MGMLFLQFGLYGSNFGIKLTRAKCWKTETKIIGIIMIIIVKTKITILIITITIITKPILGGRNLFKVILLLGYIIEGQKIFLWLLLSHYIMTSKDRKISLFCFANIGVFGRYNKVTFFCFQSMRCHMKKI